MHSSVSVHDSFLGRPDSRILSHKFFVEGVYLRQSRPFAPFPPASPYRHVAPPSAYERQRVPEKTGQEVVTESLVTIEVTRLLPPVSLILETSSGCRSHFSFRWCTHEIKPVVASFTKLSSLLVPFNLSGSMLSRSRVESLTRYDPTSRYQRSRRSEKTLHRAKDLQPNEKFYNPTPARTTEYGH